MKKYIIANQIEIKTNVDFWFLPSINIKETRDKKIKNRNRIYFILRENVNLPTPSKYIDYFGGSRDKENCIIYNEFGCKVLIKNLLDNCRVVFNSRAFKLLNISELAKNILQIKLLQNNLALLHASAVTSEKYGIVITAWSGFGKTPLLVKILKNFKLNYVSDELTIVSEDGILYPLPRNFKEEYSKKLKIPEKFLPIILRIPGIKKVKTLVQDFKPRSIETNEKRIKFCVILQLSEKNCIQTLSKNDALEKILQILEESMSILKHKLIKYYFYLNELSYNKFIKKRENVIKNFLKSVKCFEIYGKNTEEHYRQLKFLIGDIY